MKKLISVVAVLFAGLVVNSAAYAGPILGSDTISGSGFSAGNLATPGLSLTGTYATAAGGNADFGTSPAANFGAVTLNFGGSGGSILTFTAPGYGTFVSAGFISDLIGGGPGFTVRVVSIAGSFTPAFGGFAPSLATFTATYLQIPSVTGPITLAGDATLTATGAAVPEPGTLVLLGTFLVPASVMAIRRRRMLAK